MNTTELQNKFDSFILSKIISINLNIDRFFISKIFAAKQEEKGFEANSFWTKCDSKYNTISILLSEHGDIYGGYTSNAWIQRYDSLNSGSLTPPTSPESIE